MGEVIQFEHIFQMGWNHEAVKITNLVYWGFLPSLTDFPVHGQHPKVSKLTSGDIRFSVLQKNTSNEFDRLIAIGILEHSFDEL